MFLTSRWDVSHPKVLLPMSVGVRLSPSATCTVKINFLRLLRLGHASCNHSRRGFINVNNDLSVISSRSMNLDFLIVLLRRRKLSYSHVDLTSGNHSRIRTGTGIGKNLVIRIGIGTGILGLTSGEHSISIIQPLSLCYFIL